MSKHAVRSFTDGLRKEVEHFGIKVIAIEPVMYNTGLIDLDSLMKSIDNIWEETPDEVQSVYGNKLRSKFKKVFKISILKFTRKKTSEVVNAMIRAVVLKEPHHTYKCGGILDFFIIYPLSVLPERVQNFAIKLIW